VAKRPKIVESKLFWVGILYFAEGFPFGIFYDVLPVYFRQMGVDLREIGFLSLLGLAWTVKFLWAPAVDYYRRHRRWMLVADLGMAGLLLFLSVGSGFGPAVQTAIVMFAVLSATNDIAIDGYTVELLNKSELGLANGVRNGMYRVGVLAVGVILILSHYISWNVTFAAGALCMMLLGTLCLAAPREAAINVVAQRFFLGRLFAAASAAVVLFALVNFGILSALAPLFPEQQTLIKGLAIVLTIVALAIGATLVLKRGTSENKSGSVVASTPLFGALAEILKRPYIIAVMFFILTYKLGDASMGPMVRPFWVDAGFTAQDIGLVSVIFGLGLSIAGGLIGGWIIDRVGIFHALWILGLFQAVSNLGYVWAASAIPLATPGVEPTLADRALIYFASAGESFTGGLGSVAFLAFMMAIVNKKFAAAEYAVFSSLFAITRHLSGFASGFGAHYMGYAGYFLLTFFLSFPAYLLLPWVKRVLDNALRRAA
jgi:PAT family beta-lactamase induction signal transducer AmpG